MSKKKRKAPKGNVVWRQTAEEATLANKPHYNGFACGHGAHGSAKYDRTKAKRSWEKALRQEGASRGSFLYAKVLRASARCIHRPQVQALRLQRKTCEPGWSL